jgi:hypothetical protein
VTDHIHQQEYIAYLKNQLDEACTMIAHLRDALKSSKEMNQNCTCKFTAKKFVKPVESKPVVKPDPFDDPNWLPMGRMA